jgi:hypothetical protein
MEWEAAQAPLAPQQDALGTAPAAPPDARLAVADGGGAVAHTPAPRADAAAPRRTSDGSGSAPAGVSAFLTPTAVPALKSSLKRSAPRSAPAGIAAADEAVRPSRVRSAQAHGADTLYTRLDLFSRSLRRSSARAALLRWARAACRAASPSGAPPSRSVRTRRHWQCALRPRTEGSAWRARIRRPRGGCCGPHAARHAQQLRRVRRVLRTRALELLAVRAGRRRRIRHMRALLHHRRDAGALAVAARARSGRICAHGRIAGRGCRGRGGFSRARCC